MPNTQEQRVTLKDSPIIGPLSVHEIAKAIDAIAQAEDKKEEAEHARQRMVNEIIQRYEESIINDKHSLLASLFENKLAPEPGVFASIYDANRAKGGVLLIDHECARSPDIWNPDLLAYYHPHHLPNGNEAWGVYFCASNLVDCASQSGSDPETLVMTVAVHEWFHAFMEQETGIKNPSGFSRVEEAAANAIARLWLVSNVDAILSEPVDRVLFLAAKEHGVEGYGEWQQMDKDPHRCLPILVRNGVHIDPLAYKLECASTLITQNTFERTGLESSWNGLLLGLKGEVIPCYLDMRAW